MARNTYLKEHLSFTQAGLELLSEEAQDGSGHKTLKLKGGYKIFMKTIRRA